jgi:hypothetical protein
LPLLERVRVEVYIPDLPADAYHNLLQSFEDEFTFAFGGCIGKREVRAYGCIHCQHLQPAVNFTEEDLQRYQQFEGEQPSVLERITSEPEKLKG